MKSKYVPLIISLLPVIVIVIILASVIAALGGSPTISTDTSDKYITVANETGVPWDILLLTDMCLAGYDDTDYSYYTNDTYNTNYTTITYTANNADDLNNLNPLDTALNFLILDEVKETWGIVGYETTSGATAETTDGDTTTGAAVTTTAPEVTLETAETTDAAVTAKTVTTAAALTPIYGWVYDSTAAYSGKSAILKYAGLSVCPADLNYAVLKNYVQQSAAAKSSDDKRYTVTFSVNTNYYTVLLDIGITSEDAVAIIEAHDNGELNE